MPNVPKWIADQMENLLASKYLDVEVKRIENLGPEIRIITFAAELEKIAIHPGASMVFRVGDKELRHYTPATFNCDEGEFEIIFHIHGGGPGSDLVSRLKLTDRLKVSLPGGRRLYEEDEQHHFFFGDETSLSFYSILLAELEKQQGTVRALFELNECNRHIPAALGYEVDTVLKTPATHGANAIAWLEARMQAEPDLFNRSVFYLTGNIPAIQRFRTMLKKYGISAKKIKLQGYWAEGSVGL
ncbi:siderophore-interacting protein [Filimonas effusa]|uniref:Siderophore-interacting protein n=1 Tax=Filimonas effusa TaxID=2508721 RepID=A0A4Q1DBQ2_9BACT|nr:siderophore-interacting protein [Filimonas effusa]RXK86891.1 siderophore-interacting protein [Filimonas effusa]